MSVKKKKKKRIWVRVLVILLMLILCMGGGAGIYLSSYYHASDSALAAVAEPAEGVAVDQEDGFIAFAPQQDDDPADGLAVSRLSDSEPDTSGQTTGLIFYPGGKVQYEAYAPLMERLAAGGVLCVLVHMPGNLAVLDKDAAEDIRQQFPQVEHWYLAGHSLGGVMAASFLSEHAADFDGLVLLASYSTKDLSKTDLRVLSMYGSEDKVLSWEQYEKNSGNLPEDTEEFIIDGGCHAYFGDYGPQKGDGKPTITREQQLDGTAEEILRWME